MDIEIFRNSYRHALGVWAAALVPFAIASASIPRLTAELPTLVRVPALCVVIGIALAWLIEPLWAARFRTLTVDASEVVLRTGWLSVETRTARTEEITSVQLDQPLANKITRLWSVSVFTHGVAEAAMTMPAVERSDALRIAALVEPAAQSTAVEPTPQLDHGATPTSDVAGDADPRSQPTVLYRASTVDVVVTALSNGVPLVIAAGVVGMVSDVAGVSGGIDWASPVVIAVLLAGGGVIVALVTALKFWNYTIERTPQGTLTTRYGAVDAVQHTLVPDDKLALTAHRSIVDLLTGKVSLRYSHARADGAEGRRVVFPSMAPATLTATLVAIDHRASQLNVPGTRASWLLSQTALTVAGALVIVDTVRDHRFVLTAVAAMSLVVAMWGLRFASRRVSLETSSESVEIHTAGFVQTSTLVPNQAISMMVSRRVPFLSWRLVSLTGWSHGRLRYTCMTGSTAILSELTARVGLPVGTGVSSTMRGTADDRV